MDVRPIVPVLLCAIAVFGLPTQHVAQAQSVRAEVGGGWAIPSSEVTMTEGEGAQPTTLEELNLGPGPTLYAAVGLVWTLSDNFDLEGRLRAQRSRMAVDGEDFEGTQCGGACTLQNDPDGWVRGATIEGQLTLTSVGRVHPYVLVGLGVSQTTVEAAKVRPPEADLIALTEVDVTDAGGDVGFGATTRIVGGLSATAEARVTGSLPGAKDDAVTLFPFTLGLSYTF
jgi:opacity protein-like surface antigen